jgi:hypothetical protein
MISSDLHIGTPAIDAAQAYMVDVAAHNRRGAAASMLRNGTALAVPGSPTLVRWHLCTEFDETSQGICHEAFQGRSEEQRKVSHHQFLHL